MEDRDGGDSRWFVRKARCLRRKSRSLHYVAGMSRSQRGTNRGSEPVEVRVEFQVIVNGRREQQTQRYFQQILPGTHVTSHGVG